MSRAVLRDAVEVDAPATRLWEVVTDWPRQGEWIPLTRVRTPAGDGKGVGTRVEAWTGVGRVGFLDTMIVTRWSEEPHGRKVCEVLHTGRVVRGEGGFEVEPAGQRRSRLLWWESVELPLGPVGVVGWRLLRPLWRIGTRRALQRLRGLAEGSIRP